MIMTLWTLFLVHSFLIRWLHTQTQRHTHTHTYTQTQCHKQLHVSNAAMKSDSQQIQNFKLHTPLKSGIHWLAFQREL